MGKAGVNWDDTQTWQRLVASIIASGVKLDLRTVALYYGTTYDTLENRLRKVKKEAAVLKDEVESGQRGEVAPVRAKSTNNTPRKKSPSKTTGGALETVTNGRITKSAPKKSSIVKQEQFENDLSFLTSTGYSDPSSFDDAPIPFEFGQSFGHSSILDTNDTFSFN